MPKRIAFFFVAIGWLCASARAGNAPSAADDAFLEDLSQRTFAWFWDTTNPVNGLAPDRGPPASFASVAAVGFALTAYPIGVERGYITRAQAIERVLHTLRFFRDAPQGTASRDVTGYRGFFYHFLDQEHGLRIGSVELSTIDTALMVGGALFCRSYFDGAGEEEAEIRALADAIYRRIEWDWAVERPPLLSMGWDPEFGFIQADYRGYDEAMLLYVLALGSPTFSIRDEAWTAFTHTYHWAEFHGQEHLNFGPLFGHQYSHVWVDFRGIQDAYMRAKGIDYFENSRRATFSQRAYAIANPGGWKDYGPEIWGLSACDGPADVTLNVAGRSRLFRTYAARGVGADGVYDDGTIAPTAAGGSIAFAPEIAIPALHAMRARYGDAIFTAHGFVDAFNPTFTFTDAQLHHGKIVPGVGWVDTQHLGIDQGPILLMLENHRSGLIWSVMRRNPYIARGLQRAGFTGGWLEAQPPHADATIPARDRDTLLRQDDGDEIRIVVLGTPDIAGAGAPTWIEQLQAYARGIDARVRVLNFGRRCVSSSQLLPDDAPAAGDRLRPDRELNITRALARRASAVVVCLPANDARRGVDVAEQLAVVERVRAAAAQAEVPVWFVAPWPRELPEPVERNLQALRAALRAHYGDQVILAEGGDLPRTVFERLRDADIVQRALSRAAATREPALTP